MHSTCSLLHGVQGNTFTESKGKMSGSGFVPFCVKGCTYDRPFLFLFLAGHLRFAQSTSPKEQAGYGILVCFYFERRG